MENINVENVSIDPNLAEFAAKCGPEKFKSYLDFITEQTRIKSDLLMKNLDVESQKLKNEALELESKNAFYDAVTNISGDIVNYSALNKTNQPQNQDDTNLFVMNSKINDKTKQFETHMKINEKKLLKCCNNITGENVVDNIVKSKLIGHLGIQSIIYNMIQLFTDDESDQESTYNFAKKLTSLVVDKLEKEIRSINLK